MDASNCRLRDRSTSDPRRPSRRAFLAATAGLVGVAGCSGGDGTGGSSATPTEPSGQLPIPGRRLWLHPDAEMVTSDGAVETWRDASGHGHDFTQSVAKSRPRLLSDAIGGHAALRFDGEDDFFRREDTLGIADDSPRTHVVVSRLSDPTARSPYLMQGKFGSSGATSNYYGMEANTYRTAGERFGLYLVSVGNDSQRQTDTAFHVHVLRTAEFPSLSAIEESTTYHVDGREVPFGPAPGGARNSPFQADSTAIGAFPGPDPSVLMGGQIAEIRVYDRAIDDTERAALENHLLEKYGLDSG